MVSRDVNRHRNWSNRRPSQAVDNGAEQSAVETD